MKKNKAELTPQQKKKRLIKSLAITLSVLIVVTVFVCIDMQRGGKGEPNTKVWFSYMAYGDETQTYDTVKGYVMDYSFDYIVEMQKDPNKDFVVLNLADIQKMGVSFMFGDVSMTFKTIDKLIEEVKPDLITLSGDNTWGIDSYFATKRLIARLEKYQIPYAPVFGNHDGEFENLTTNNALADLFLQAEHCLFKKGPSNIGGVGNYVINVKEGDEIVHTLFMMDSGGKNSYYQREDGVVKHYYDFIQQEQIDWYKWVVEGIAKEQGHVIESTCIFHIPLPEFKTAHEMYQQGELPGLGTKYEDVGCPRYNSGFFDVIKQLGSTKRVIVGHDHVNDSIVNYQGVDLVYALKTGDGCYWTNDGTQNGGTVITIGDQVTVRQHYVQVPNYNIFKNGFFK